mmetsp:Transcript_25304/g.60479  ORF Transcript_25304/g.60479 Transcript_25304/m.60479 type:complete len:231 (-) Transcript_25304:231-923(-)
MSTQHLSAVRRRVSASAFASSSSLRALMRSASLAGVLCSPSPSDSRGAGDAGLPLRRRDSSSASTSWSVAITSSECREEVRSCWIDGVAWPMNSRTVEASTCAHRSSTIRSCCESVLRSFITSLRSSFVSRLPSISSSSCFSRACSASTWAVLSARRASTAACLALSAASCCSSAAIFPAAPSGASSGAIAGRLSPPSDPRYFSITSAFRANSMERRLGVLRSISISSTS